MERTWGLPPPVKLEHRHMTYTMSVWRKTQLNKQTKFGYVELDNNTININVLNCLLQGAKKLCPQCNMITSPADLRRIYLWKHYNNFKICVVIKSGLSLPVTALQDLLNGLWSIVLQSKDALGFCKGVRLPCGNITRH
jgi:hypothetical protein